MTPDLRHLNALRAFEVAARHESFSKAAAELNVSHSVVSQHIKNLEAWFCTDLFVRTGNRVMLSDDGRALLPRISGAFQTMKDACADLLQANQKGTLLVSAEPALASLWLRKKIAEFCDEFPNINVELRPAWQPPQIGESHVDLIIHFEARLPANASHTQRLFPIDGYPSCSPKLAARLNLENEQLDWQSVPLVHDNGREIWHHWFVQHEPHSVQWEEGRVYSDLSLAIHAAEDSEGIILADDILCHRQFETGSLQRIDKRQVRCAWYAMAIPASETRKPAVDTFSNWLETKVADLAYDAGD